MYIIIVLSVPSSGYYKTGCKDTIFYTHLLKMRKFVLIFYLINSVFIHSITYGTVVFNEVMIDPEPSVGLPEVEYIELFNTSAKSISLKGWFLFYEDKAYPFPDCSIDSMGYLVLCSKAASLQMNPIKNLAAFNSFPTLSNSGKLVYMITGDGVLMHDLQYIIAWHSNSFKTQGGWSLECLDAGNLSGLSSNWASSENENGGTPGFKNSVAAINPDVKIPSLLESYVLSSTEIQLNFTKRMQPELLSKILNYEIVPSNTLVTKVVPAFPGCQSVVLKLSDSLVSGVTYELKTSNLRDVSGISLKDSLVVFGLPENPVCGDLSLNELLFNPVYNGCDYVEIVNISKKCLDLSKVWLSSRSESGLLKEGVRLTENPVPCLPGSYWLLSVSADTVASVNDCSSMPNSLDMRSFPSMPDASGNVVLLTSSAQILDEMSYSEKMHFDLINQYEGVSLEKLNPGLTSFNPNFWQSASSSSGYGTPGVQNSQYMDSKDVKTDGFSIERSWITPNMDGVEDLFQLTYHFAESNLANITVYDLNGRIVKNLAKNELLASSGSIYWDGTAENGAVLPFGRYILQAECFTSTGKKIVKRFVLTVLF